MRSWIVSALLVAVCLSSGCLPSRDNPSDPKNRPVAALAVSGGPELPNVGGRQTDFLLDASESKVPGGAGTFRFDLDGDLVFETPGAACPTAPSLDACVTTKLLIPADVLPGGVGAVQLTVGVEVTKAGAQDTAAAVVTLVNRAPPLPRDRDFFAPPRTGGLVRLDLCVDCGEIDPDGDDLFWTWNLVRGDLEGGVLSGADTGAAALDHAPWRDATLVWRVDADDGLATASTLVRLHVTSQAWATGIQPNRVYRVFPDFRPLRVHDGEGQGAYWRSEDGGLFVDGDRVWTGVGVHSTGGQLVAAEIDTLALSADGGDFAVESHWRLDGRYAPTSIARDGLGCAALRSNPLDPSPIPSRFVRLDPLDAPSMLVGAGANTLLEEPAWVFPGADATDDCWAVTRRVPGGNGRAGVYRLRADATVAPLAPFAMGQHLADATAAGRTSDGALWVAGTAASGCAGTRVSRIPTFSATAESWCFPEGPFDQLVPGPGSSVWAHDESSKKTFLLTTAGDLSDSGALPIKLPPHTEGAGTLQDTTFPEGEPRMAYDPVERHLWAVDVGQGVLLRLDETDGLLSDVQTVPGSSFEILQGYPAFTAVAFWDALGRAVTHVQNSTSALVGQVPTHLHRIEEVFVSAEFVNVSVDPSSGDAWVTTGAPSGAVHRVGIDGVPTATYDVPPDARAWGPAALADGGAWIAIDRQDGTGTLARIDAAGAVISQDTLAHDTPLFRVDVAADGTLCAVGQVSEQDRTADVLLRLADGTISEMASPMVSGSAGTFDWSFPLGISALSGSCWFTFVDGNVKVVHYDGDVIVDSTILARSFVDADPVTGLAWLAGFGEDLFTLDDAGVFTQQSMVLDSAGGGVFPNGVDAVAVRRSCRDGVPCSLADPLHVWLIDGQAVLRYTEDGQLEGRWSLPNFATAGDFELVP